MIQEMQIANQLIEASETLRRLLPDTYDELSLHVQAVIRKVMEAQQKDVLPAALTLMDAAWENGDELHIQWIAAAACDMLCGQHPHESLRTRLQKLADSFKL